MTGRRSLSLSLTFFYLYSFFYCFLSKPLSLRHSSFFSLFVYLSIPISIFFTLFLSAFLFLSVFLAACLYLSLFLSVYIYTFPCQPFSLCAYPSPSPLLIFLSSLLLSHRSNSFPFLAYLPIALS